MLSLMLGPSNLVLGPDFGEILPPLQLSMGARLGGRAAGAVAPAAKIMLGKTIVLPPHHVPYFRSFFFEKKLTFQFSKTKWPKSENTNLG